MGSDAYAVTRERDGTYQLHAMEPDNRIIARIKPVLDRTGQVIGWKLKPLVVLQGATSRLWRSPAEAIAATKLLTPAKAKAAVQDAGAGQVADQATTIVGEAQ